jgi:hypothetical protein
VRLPRKSQELATTNASVGQFRSQFQGLAALLGHGRLSVLTIAFRFDCQARAGPPRTPQEESPGSGKWIASLSSRTEEPTAPHPDTFRALFAAICFRSPACRFPATPRNKKAHGTHGYSTHSTAHQEALVGIPWIYGGSHFW